jgi:hypothetical protein
MGVRAHRCLEAQNPERIWTIRSSSSRIVGSRIRNHVSDFRDRSNKRLGVTA